MGALNRNGQHILRYKKNKVQNKVLPQRKLPESYALCFSLFFIMFWGLLRTSGLMCVLNLLDTTKSVR